MLRHITEHISQLTASIDAGTAAVAPSINAIKGACMSSAQVSGH